MLSINNKFLLFISVSASIFLAGSTLEVNSYENNQLIGIDNSFAKIILSEKTYQLLKPKELSWFKYYIKNQEFQMKISSVQKTKDKWTVILHTEGQQGTIKNITYGIKSTNIWKEITRL